MRTNAVWLLLILGICSRPADTSAQAPTPGQVGGQSLNPDISAIGELLIDFSSRRPKTTSSGQRFEVREVELGIQAVVDPFFRADFFIGLHPEEVEIEEAYLTALVLPGGFQGRLGRFHVPLGKVNLIHRPEQITIDYPWMIRDFFGDEGLASNGVGLSRVFAPLGFFQELHVYALSGLGSHEHAHGEEEEEPADDDVLAANDDLLNQVAFVAQLRNYVNLSQAANVEFGVSAGTGRIRELEASGIGTPAFREVFETQRYYGAHVTFRWRPAQQGLYRSFIWNNEVLVNDGHEGKRLGAFSQAQYQLTRRTYLGGRFDAVQTLDESAEKNWFNAVSGYVTAFPSEFSRFKLGVERTFGNGDPFGGEWRAVLQTTFAIGPHRPHAF
ncbi:MAG: hypothetical protein WEE89_02210 [Gemmatimonadota bacterium]